MKDNKQKKNNNGNGNVWLRFLLVFTLLFTLSISLVSAVNNVSVQSRDIFTSNNFTSFIDVNSGEWKGIIKNTGTFFQDQNGSLNRFATDTWGGNHGTLNGYTTNNGIVSGGVTIEDGAMVFNGSASTVLTAGNNYNIASGDIRTFNIWADFTANDNNVFFMKRNFGGGTESGFSVQVRNDGRFRYYFGNGTTGVDRISVITDVNSGGYRLVTFEIDRVANLMTVYLDGVAIEAGRDISSVTGDQVNSNTFYLVGTPFNNPTTNVTSLNTYLNKKLSSSDYTQILTAGHNSYSPISNGLVGQWTGRDFLGPASNPTHVLDTNMVVSDGENGTSLNFNGINQSVTIPTTGFNVSSGTIISNFVIPNGYFPSNTEFIFGHFNSGNRLYIMNANSNSLLRFQIGSGADFSSSIGGWNDGVEHQAILTYDGSVMTAYIDGVYMGNVSYTGLSSFSANAYIGDNPPSGGGEWNGSISDVIILNSSLNSSEALELYNNPSSIVSHADSLVATYGLGRDLYSVLKGNNFSTSVDVSNPEYFSYNNANYAWGETNVFDLTQAYASFSAVGSLGNSINDFNVTINGNTLHSSQVWNISAGSYNVTFSKSGFVNYTQEVEILGVQSNNIVLSGVYRYSFNVTLRDNFANSSISNFGLNTLFLNEYNVSNINFTFMNNFSNANGLINSISFWHRGSSDCFGFGCSSYNGRITFVYGDGSNSSVVTGIAPSGSSYDFVSISNPNSSKIVSYIILEGKSADSLPSFVYFAKNFSIDGSIFNTNNGSITIFNSFSSDLFDFIFNGSFYSSSYLGVNVSSGFVGGVDLARFNLTTTDLFGNVVSNSSYVLSNGTFTSSVYGSGVFNPVNIGLFDLTVFKSGYYNFTDGVVFSGDYPYNTSLSSWAIYDSLVTVELVDLVNNLSVSDFSVNLTIGDYLGYFDFSSTSNGSLVIPVMQGFNYTLSVTGDGIASRNVSVFVNSSAELFTIGVYAFNSVNVRIFNGTSSDLLLQNVSVTVISNESSFVTSTVNGSLYLQLLSPTSYELRFNSVDYNPISKFVVVTSDSSQVLDVFMIESNLTEIQLIRVLDTSSLPVEGAVVWLQQQVIVNGSEEWITVQESETNFDGLTSVFVEKSLTEFYRFAVFLDGVALSIQPNNNFFTGRTYFIPGVTETLILVVNTQDVVPLDLTDYNNIATRIYFGGVGNNTVFFEWVDGANIVSGGFMVVSARVFTGNGVNLSWEEINFSTSTGSSGLLSFELANVSGVVYKIDGYLIFNSYYALYDSELKSFGDVFVDRNTGMFMAVIILLFTIFLTVKYGALMSSIISIGSLIILNWMQLINVPVMLITSTIVLCIVLFYKPEGRL